jgi:hypothetical protein
MRRIGGCSTSAPMIIDRFNNVGKARGKISRGMRIIQAWVVAFGYEREGESRVAGQEPRDKSASRLWAGLQWPGVGWWGGGRHALGKRRKEAAEEQGGASPCDFSDLRTWERSR